MWQAYNFTRQEPPYLKISFRVSRKYGLQASPKHSSSTWSEYTNNQQFNVEWISLFYTF